MVIVDIVHFCSHHLTCLLQDMQNIGVFPSLKVEEICFSKYELKFHFQS